ncbi:hypothetical protein KY289_017246 [Solanum tuberosum]|nr:hypothetical protein KY289_017246 [Solanum tuberosum]
MEARLRKQLCTRHRSGWRRRDLLLLGATFLCSCAPSAAARDLLCCCDGGVAWRLSGVVAWRRSGMGGDGHRWGWIGGGAGVGRGWGVRLHLGFETSLRSET